MLTTHSIENNEASQAHLDANRPHFNKQCARVMALLMAGKVLTVQDCVIEHKIFSLPRRVADCRESGALISDRWDRVMNCKLWFMTDADRFANVHRFGPTAKAAP